MVLLLMIAKKIGGAKDIDGSVRALKFEGASK